MGDLKGQGSCSRQEVPEITWESQSLHKSFPAIGLRPFADWPKPGFLNQLLAREMRKTLQSHPWLMCLRT